MIYIKIILNIIIITKICHGHSQIPPNIYNRGSVRAIPHVPDLFPNPSICNTTSEEIRKHFGLQFSLPFLDMEISTRRTLHVVKEPKKQNLFLLHGNELYQMFVSSGGKNLSLVGVLDGIVNLEETMGVAVISWQSFLIMAVQLQEDVEIYQISEAKVKQSAEISRNPDRMQQAPPSFEPIQHLTLPGNIKKLFLTDVKKNEIMLIISLNYTKTNTKLRTYEWTSTYFEIGEELTFPKVDHLFVVGKYPKYFIKGRIIRHQSKTIINVYEIRLPASKLHYTQTFTVSSRIVHAFTYRSMNFLIGCALNQSDCNIFLMWNGEFKVHKSKRQGSELAFDKFDANDNFLVGSRQREIYAYSSANMDCYASYSSNDTDVASIITFTKSDENFVLLNYKREGHRLVRLVEIVKTRGGVLGQAAANFTEEEVYADNLSPLHQQNHEFEEKIGQLRSMLLKRKAAMDTFRRVGNVLTPRIRNVKVNNPVNVHAGNIGIIRIVDKDIRSPMQLLQRINEIGRTRFIRSTDVENGNWSMDLLKVKRLNVRNLIYSGNVLEGFHLENTTKSLPTLTIQPQITTKALNTQELLTPAENKYRYQGYSEETFRIRQLNVERINNMTWKAFINETFFRNRDTIIVGRIIMQAPLHVLKLTTPVINGLVVNQLFNLKQPQVIHSRILIRAVFITNLQVERINGLNFTHDIVFSGQDTFIETPVRMSDVNISGELIVVNVIKASNRLAEDADDWEFQQYYTGKVVLNGTLTVNNLIRHDPMKTAIFIDDSLFSESIIKELYLLQNETQTINMPVNFGNAKVTTPKLNTKYLNNHPTSQHLLATDSSTAETATKPLLIFLLAKVEGDLNCRDYSSKIAQLHKDAVRPGEVANITGVKIFTAPLTVDHLMTLQLNNMPVTELVLKSQLQQLHVFGGTKTFDQAIVYDNAQIGRSLNISYLNSLPLADLLNYDYYLNTLYLPHELQLKNIEFEEINGIPAGEVFNKIKLQADGNLVLYKDLFVEGSVQFTEDLHVDSINGIEWNSYLESVVRINENALIRGQKQFLYDLTVTDLLQTPTLNNVNMHEVFVNVLSKSCPQTITGAYTFNTIRLTNLDVRVINNMPTAEFIDTRAKDVTIESDIIMPKMTVHGDVEGNFINHFQFASVHTRLKELPKQQWRNLVVLGNAYWNVSSVSDKTQYEQLQYLHKHAVRRNGNQVITGNVKFARPIITRMKTATTIRKDIDLDFIIKDSLLKNSSVMQTVKAPKRFTKSLYLQNVTVKSLIHTKLLNNIDVLRLNASLYRLSSDQPIVGPLYFRSPPVIGRLVVKGLVNGISSDQIYHLSNTTLPPISLRSSLEIDNALQVEDINEMSLQYLLDNRVTKNGPALEIFGFLTFENLILNKKILLQSINGIPIDNLVFTRSNQLQPITGAKKIIGDLVLAGPAHVLNLNGQDLVNIYQESVFTNQNYHFVNLTVDQATFERGLILTNPLAQAQGRAEEAEIFDKNFNLNLKEKGEMEIIDDVVDILNKKDSLRRLMYLYYDSNTQLIWQTPTIAEAATIDETFNYQIEHLSVCERRLLQVQKSKLTKRIYLANLTTNLITSQLDSLSVKARNLCEKKYRKAKSKITLTGKNISKVVGMKKYIKNVKIFAINTTEVYLLLHAIDLLRNRNEVRVLKIDDERNNISDWQSLNYAVGSKIMRLYQLADNSTKLLLAGLLKHHPAVSIYRFVPQLQKFKLTQTINGDYDIMEMIITPETHKRQLILSCHQCQVISIYEFQSTTKTETPYRIFQIIKLKSHIEKLMVFTLSDGNLYLFVVAENIHGLYHLYKYAHIQGWIHLTYGYFNDLQTAMPLFDVGKSSAKPIDDNLLLMLCRGNSDDNNCSILKAFTQP